MMKSLLEHKKPSTLRAQYEISSETESAREGHCHFLCDLRDNIHEVRPIFTSENLEDEGLHYSFFAQDG
jgi:hypothetical protein